jgi:tripartite-type tricarboxylate transporter receptor subunit TctC
MRELVSAFLIAFSVLAAVGVQAEDYPTRPVTIIVPFPAGGSTDAIARILSEGMRSRLGQTIVVENVGGASGNIAVGRVARAAPDGYTLVLGSWPTHVLNAAIFTLPYDPISDFEPVSLVSTQPLFIIGRKSLPATNLSELIAWLKANPGRGTQGTAGSGGASHVAGVFFQKASETQFQLVPYRGAGPAMQDLAAGQIDMMVDLAASAAPQVRAGNVKAFAVTSKKRSEAAPDVPTVDEAGLPGFYVESWHAVWAPKGTPREVVEKLSGAILHTLDDPAVRQRLGTVGQVIFPADERNARSLAAYQRAEADKWWPIIKAAKISAQ